MWYNQTEEASAGALREQRGFRAVYRMGAFVRVLPLLAAAAQLAACSTNNAAKGTADGTRAVAGVSAAPIKFARAFPDRDLLSRQPAPECELKTPPADIRPEEVRVVTIDYERQCYRQLAGIAHARVAKLQDEVARTHALGSRDQALLQRDPPPHCDSAKPPAGPPEARAAALDAERQCFRQIAASEGTKLEALQDAVRKASASARRSSARPAPPPAPSRRSPQDYMTY